MAMQVCRPRSGEAAKFRHRASVASGYTMSTVDSWRTIAMQHVVVYVQTVGYRAEVEQQGANLQNAESNHRLIYLDLRHSL